MQDRTQHKIGGQNRDIQDKVQQVVNYPNSRSSNCYISSENKIDGTYSHAIYENNNLLSRNTSQIGLKDYSFNWCLENVNNTNNTFTVEIAGEGSPFTASVPSDHYVDEGVLISTLVDELNAVLGLVAEFSFTLTNNCTIILSCDKDFRFVNPSSGISLGYSVFGIPFTNTLSNDFKIVPDLHLTNYIDLLITEIKQSEFTSDTFTEIQKFPLGDHIARIMVNESITIPRIIKKEIKNIDYFGFRHRNITGFSVSLYSEYGQLLHSETFQSGSDNIEIPLVKYNITLNIIS